MADRDDIGFSWGDIESAGRTVFPYVHTAGKGLASAFGAGALAEQVETLEKKGGLLPATPTTTAKTSPTRGPSPAIPQQQLQPATLQPQSQSQPPKRGGPLAWIKANPGHAAAYSALGIGAILLIVKLVKRGSK